MDQLKEAHKFIKCIIQSQNITEKDKILYMGDFNIDAYNFTKRPTVIIFININRKYLLKLLMNTLN